MPVDGAPELHNLDLDALKGLAYDQAFLAFLNEQVGGYVAAVRGPGSMLVWVNDDGLALNLPVNRTLPRYLAMRGDLVGPVVITGTMYRTDDGDERYYDYPEEVFSAL